MEESTGTMIKLNHSNYAIWKPRMEDHLIIRDLWDPVLGDAAKPEGKSDAEWERMHRKTVGQIRAWIDQSVFNHVSKETRADVLWKKLEAMYERKHGLNKASLLKKITRLRYKEGSSMSEHLNDFQGLINHCATLKLNLDDEVQALLLFSSLPDSWETLFVTISNSTPNGVLTLDMVKEALLNEETRRKELGQEVEGEALVFEKYGRRGRSQSRGPNRGRGHSRGKSVSRKEVECFYCKRKGHIKKDCWNWKRDFNKGKEEQKKQENVLEETTATASDGDVIIVSDENSLNFTFQDFSWVIDSGASYHVTPHKEFFSSYHPIENGFVKMGDSSTCKIHGFGDVLITTALGCK